MKKNIYFITSVDPLLDTGASIIRRGQIKYLRENNFNVIVVSPGENLLVEKNRIIVPSITTSKIRYLFEAFGIIKDKDINWAKQVRHVLKDVVTEDDIIFVTTGGSMAPIFAGYWLKKDTQAKLIINYHDPTSFTTLNGDLFTRSFHVNRDNLERKYINEADYIITSSIAYLKNLVRKYPCIANKASCCYFGFIQPIEGCGCTLTEQESINIVYGGNMGQTQAPEILAEAVDGMDNVKAFFIGNYHSNPTLLKYKGSKNVELIESMDLNSFYEFLKDKADVGFFSLRTYLSDYCVPSKLFDYINLELPCLAVVRGDAADIIKENGFGFVSEDSVESLRIEIRKINRSDTLTQFKTNLKEKKYMWSMQYLTKDICKILEKI